MENLIETIRAATTSDASEDARLAGAQACRTILAALEATKGEALVATQAIQPVTPSGGPTAAVQAIASALRGMPADQLLDLAIARLKAALPPGSNVGPVRPVKFDLVPIASPRIPGR